MLTMKIQRHDVLSTMSPPMSGPATLDRAKMLVNAPTYLPRSRGGTMSAITMKDIAIAPPLPIPCTALAKTSMPMFCASEHRSDPSRKTTMANWVKRLRP